LREIHAAQLAAPGSYSASLQVIMQIDIKFRGMPHSVAAEMSARRWIERLRRVSDDILRCAVVVEIPHHHQQRDPLFHVRIELLVPGQALAVTRDPGNAAGHDDVYAAISDAFRTARRRLQQYVAIRRREVKAHSAA
jgi:ribosome-associated translation inhibitor RaiA